MNIRERKVIQNFINKSNELTEERDQVWKDLQKMAFEQSGKMRCSLDAMIDDAMKLNPITTVQLIRKYHEIGAKIDVINEFGLELANIGFFENDLK
jgi:hypothetical protein